MPDVPEPDSAVTAPGATRAANANDAADAANEVRGFLTSRRARLSPEQVGLTAGGERRVPGLRREEVAQLAGVSPDYYTRLERGRIQGASDSVLTALSEALRLDDVERAYLFALAHGPLAAEPVPREQREQSGTASVGSILQYVTTPGLAVSVSQDIMAANLLGRALYSSAYDAMERPNLARLAFEHQWDEVAGAFYGENLEQARSLIAAMMRMEAARQPGADDLISLIKELEQTSADFRDAWARQEVHEHRSGTKVFRHNVVGELELSYNVLTAPGVPGIGVTVYGPVPGTDAAERLAALEEWARTQDFATQG